MVNCTNRTDFIQKWSTTMPTVAIMGTAGLYYIFLFYVLWYWILRALSDETHRIHIKNAAAALSFAAALFFAWYQRLAAGSKCIVIAFVAALIAVPFIAIPFIFAALDCGNSSPVGN